MTRLARRYRFSASHRLHTARLSAEANRETYGKCNNPFGHGHNYVLEVRVSGQVDAATGRVIAPLALDALVRAEVVDRYDHADLNSLPEFAALVPTTENLAVVIERRLTDRWPADWPRLDAIGIEETRRNKFELRR